MSELIADLRFGLRQLRRHPLAAAMSLGTLAAGLALSAILLALLHAAFVQPLPYPEPDRLIDLQSSREQTPERRFGISPADFLVWKETLTGFESLGAYVAFGNVDLTGEGEPVRLASHLATAGLFDALAVPPLLGRTFLEGEEQPGADRVAVLGYPLWQSRFGGDPEVVGRDLRLDGQPYTVIGVMPPGFGARGGTPDLWLPLSFGEHRRADRRTHYLGAIGRLRSGVTLSDVRRELRQLTLQLEAELPATNTDLRGSALPLAGLMTAGVRQIFLLLLVAVAMVLTVAVLNVTNLKLALALARAREFELRASLGASRRRLLRQNVTEGMLLGLLAGGLGAVLGVVGLRILPDLRGTYLHGYVEPRLDLALGAAVLLLAAAIGALIGLGTGLRTGRRIGLRGEHHGSVGGGLAPRASDLLVCAQTALSMTLILGATLALRSVGRLEQVDLGFTRPDTLAAELTLSRARYPSGEQVTAFRQQLLDAVERLPGVESAAIANAAPGGGWGFRTTLEGGGEESEIGARWMSVSPGYFRTAGIPLLRGRDFTPGDDAAAVPVMVINRQAARELFGDRDPLGRRLDFGSPGRWHEIVGVVGDVRGDPTRQAEAACYVRLEQHLDLIEEAELRQMTLLAAPRPTHPGGPALATEVKGMVRSLDPELPLAAAATLEERVVRSIFRPRLGSRVLTLFALLALALAAFGLYGVLALTVRLRWRELALRLALGAHPIELKARVVRRGIGLVLAGIALGFGLAVPLRSLIDPLRFSLPAFDPFVLGVAPLVLLLAALLASWLPARLLASLDPARALGE